MRRTNDQELAAARLRTQDVPAEPELGGGVAGTAVYPEELQKARGRCALAAHLDGRGFDFAAAEAAPAAKAEQS